METLDTLRKLRSQIKYLVINFDLGPSCASPYYHIVWINVCNSTWKGDFLSLILVGNFKIYCFRIAYIKCS